MARVVNRGGQAGEVRIEAFDDTDREYDVVTLAVGAGEAAHFNSDDLEDGNADKGPTGSTGAGTGAWRLELTSALDIEVLSYVRTADGFLTAMHDVVPRDGTRYRVAVLNPGRQRGPGEPTAPGQRGRSRRAGDSRASTTPGRRRGPKCGRRSRRGARRR